MTVLPHTAILTRIAIAILFLLAASASAQTPYAHLDPVDSSEPQPLPAIAFSSLAQPTLASTATSHANAGENFVPSRRIASPCPFQSALPTELRASCGLGSVVSVRRQPSRLRRAQMRRLAFRNRIRNRIFYVSTPSYSVLTPEQRRLLRTLSQCSSIASSEFCWTDTLSDAARATFFMITHVLEETEFIDRSLISYVTKVEGLLAKPKTTHLHELTSTRARVDGWRMHLMIEGVSEDKLRPMRVGRDGDCRHTGRTPPSAIPEIIAIGEKMRSGRVHSCNLFSTRERPRRIPISTKGRGATTRLRRTSICASESVTLWPAGI